MNMDKRIKNPFFGITRQLEEGNKVAVEKGLEPIEYNESWLVFKPEHFVGKCQFHLLKLVLEQRAKYIYVRNINMICRNKRLLKYILHLYAVNGVTLFTKNGKYPLDKLITKHELIHELDILTYTIEELVKVPFEYVKN